MKLSDLAGVFSRYFVVGFFVPAFFGLAAASVLVTSELLPNQFERYGAGTRLVILGALAIPLGMLLQGFQPALLSGLVQHRSGADWLRFVPAWLYGLILKPQQASFERMKRLSDDDNAPLGPRLYDLARKVASSLGQPVRPERDNQASNPASLLRQHTQIAAASRLEERFPPEPSALVPTQLGNTLLATQYYTYARWGFDTWVAWPRLESLLSQEERDALSDSKAEVAFFLNAALASIAVGVVLIIDEIWHMPLRLALVPLYTLPFLLAYGLYRFSVGAAVRWGQYERAAVDLHRLELFDQLGFTTPRGYRNQYMLARALNRFMLYRPPDASAAAAEGETLLRFTRSMDGGGFRPKTDRDADRIRQLDWSPASPTHDMWLETDCLLHGVAFAREDGQRIDPRNVVVDASGVARMHTKIGFAAPSHRPTQPAVHASDSPDAEPTLPPEPRRGPGAEP